MINLPLTYPLALHAQQDWISDTCSSFNWDMNNMTQIPPNDHSMHGFEYYGDSIPDAAYSPMSTLHAYERCWPLYFDYHCSPIDVYAENSSSKSSNPLNLEQSASCEDKAYRDAVLLSRQHGTATLHLSLYAPDYRYVAAMNYPSYQHHNARSDITKPTVCNSQVISMNEQQVDHSPIVTNSDSERNNLQRRGEVDFYNQNFPADHFKNERPSTNTDDRRVHFEKCLNNKLLPSWLESTDGVPNGISCCSEKLPSTVRHPHQHEAHTDLRLARVRSVEEILRRGELACTDFGDRILFAVARSLAKGRSTARRNSAVKMLKTENPLPDNRKRTKTSRENNVANRARDPEFMELTSSCKTTEFQSECWDKLSTEIRSLKDNPLHLDSSSVRLRIYDDLTVQNGAFGMMKQGTLQNNSNPASRKKVLVKMASPENMKNDSVLVLGRLVHEWRLLQKLQHPNIIRLIGGFVKDVYDVWLVFDHGGAKDLYQIRQSGVKQISKAQRCYIALQVTRCLAWLHSRTPVVIYGNLSEKSLMVDDSFNVKLCNFGSSYEGCEGDSILFQQGTNWAYQPPEVLIVAPLRSDARAAASTKSDIWAIGILLVQLFTNQHPFAHLLPRSDDEGEIYCSLVASAREGLYADPYMPKRLPLAIRSIVQNCLRIESTLRPSAEELLQSLEIYHKEFSLQK